MGYAVPPDRGDQEQLRELYERVKRFGARDGFTLETFSQELPSATAKQYLHEAQAVADVMRPLDLETATA